MKKNQVKYKLSFNAASLKLNETIKVAQFALDNNIQDFQSIRDQGLVFSSSTHRTSIREFREIRKRLELLTRGQIELLVSGDFITQKQIGFLAICKHYLFIRDFTVEVIREKLLSFDYQIFDGDYNAFFNRKTELHPELEDFSESTLKKAKQVMFLILSQVGIINDSQQRIIQPQLLEKALLNAIVNDDPEFLKIFSLPDLDIKSAITEYGRYS
ncbi:MAG: DUF1819 family protein [Bacteroidales bacterium]|nr:DUF1819 family protein [Bacteroidales bacterium]MCF8336432.1 DUF1819 family protein [Bacteroidales bacterium]